MVFVMFVIIYRTHRQREHTTEGMEFWHDSNDVIKIIELITVNESIQFGQPVPTVASDSSYLHGLPLL